MKFVKLHALIAREIPTKTAYEIHETLLKIVMFNFPNK